MDVQSNLSDQMFDQLSKSFLHYAFERLVDGKNDRASRIAILAIIGILSYAGVEAVKLLFRNNFGEKGINRLRMILSVLSFVILAVISFSTYFNYESSELAELGSISSFLAAGIFFGLIAVFILVKGILVFSKPSNAIHENYRGDSTILHFLIKGGWKQSTVQNLAEPLLLLSIGFFLLPINLLLGIPLIFCAISVWVHLAFEIAMQISLVSNKLSNEGYVHSKGQSFSKAY